MLRRPSTSETMNIVGSEPFVASARRNVVSHPESEKVSPDPRNLTNEGPSRSLAAAALACNTRASPDTITTAVDSRSIKPRNVSIFTA